MMAHLRYTAITSLDGYVADASGSFDWAAPGEEVHAFINDLERPVGTYLYGRRLYEVMAFWETNGDDGSPAERDFAELWRAADKIVFGTTLTAAQTQRTTLRREFDAESIRRLKAESTSPLSIGGPTLAAHALRAGLVDEIGRFIVPVVVGGGIRFLPDDLNIGLTLTDERRFGSGIVYLNYAVH